MKRQLLKIDFDYHFKSIAPLKRLEEELKEALDLCSIKFKISTNVSLDFRKVSITIESKTLISDVLNVVRPVLEQTNIEATGKVTLEFKDGKFIDDVPINMGGYCQRVNKRFIEDTANLLRRNTPSKHGFLLISYSKNGSDVDLYTEKGSPKQRELIEMYMLLASNIEL